MTLLVLKFRFISFELTDNALSQLDRTVLRRSKIRSIKRATTNPGSELTEFDILLEGNPEDKHGIDTTDITAISAAMAMFQGQFAGTKETF